MSQRIERIADQNAACQRLQQIPGVGALVATAIVAAIGNGSAFVRGRDFAAWLGLVPRQHSTGGKAKLLGISKRGNPYLRRLFLHGEKNFRRINHRDTPSTRPNMSPSGTVAPVKSIVRRVRRSMGAHQPVVQFRAKPAMIPGTHAIANVRIRITVSRFA